MDARFAWGLANTWAKLFLQSSKLGSLALPYHSGRPPCYIWFYIRASRPRCDHYSIAGSRVERVLSHRAARPGRTRRACVEQGRVNELACAVRATCWLP
eukprot:6460577-Prymnesium_polylepis.1